jgi:hypothetical protein
MGIEELSDVCTVSLLANCSVFSMFATDRQLRESKMINTKLKCRLNIRL